MNSSLLIIYFKFVSLLDDSIKEKRGKDKQEFTGELESSIEKLNDNPKWANCKGRTQMCGPEAACRDFAINNTSKCVCPHDGSTPTADLKCPHRSIMSASEAPRAIPNVMLGGNQLRLDTNDENKTFISINSQVCLLLFSFK